MTTITFDAQPTTIDAADAADSPAGARIEAHRVSRTVRKGVQTLSSVSLRIEPGELVAVIGASGAGKTTLLETLAGLRLPSSGRVRIDGWDLREQRQLLRGVIGYVPQDDIIHRDLPVRSTVRHAARLRLPRRSPRELEDLVDRTIAQLGLAEQANTTVADLSGGQRKRVSIAVELLTRPRAFFLDEPTSGLDPASARSLLDSLRALAGDRSTVVLTTHSPDDVARCDKVIVLARGGRLLFQGTPGEALEHFAVDDVAAIYRVLSESRAASQDLPLPDDAPATATRTDLPERPATPRLYEQWAVLSRRNVEVLVRNRLTLAIMLGAPALVIAMFVTLYRPGAFDAGRGDPLAAVAITYWLAFAAFFFGLTYGLLQVCTEIAVVRRERNVGLGLGAYLLAKVTVLLPVLVVVNAAMVIALRATNRIPDLDASTIASLVGLLVLDATAALAMGLLASAAVADPSQATLALPMLCFPAVLFGGAVLPVRAMAAVGQAISAVTSDRWAFEALGRVLDLSTRFSSVDGAIVSNQHGDAFAGGVAGHIAIIVGFTAVLLGATIRVLDRRTSVR
jgi:ABC-type multidrug transport system ATPase subunit